MIVYRFHDQFGCRRILFRCLEPDCPIRGIAVGFLYGPFGNRKEILIVLWIHHAILIVHHYGIGLLWMLLCHVCLGGPFIEDLWWRWW